MNELDEFEYINELFELYKNLLTKKQIDIATKYFVYNLSFSEIGNELNISRAGVSDTLNTVKIKLLDYENKLNLNKKISKINEIFLDEAIDEKVKKMILEVLYYGI